MAAIFFFSSQTGVESEDMSGIAQQTIITILLRFVSVEKIPRVVAYSLEFLLRKSAHLLLFGFLGLFAASALKSYGVKDGVFLKTFAFCVLYAVSDEIHQLFIDGRAALFTDVLIDAAGSAVGIFVQFKADKFRNRRSINRHSECL